MRIFAARWLQGLGIMLAMLMGIFLLGQVILRVKRRLHPEPMPPEIAPYLEAPLRRKLFGSLERIVERAGVSPGMRVLEIGPGPGLFTVLLARRVAAQSNGGSVTCVELQSKMIEMLLQRLDAEQIGNVEVVQGDGQHLPLPDECFDMVFLVTVIGEVPDLPTFFSECARVLKPGGILSVTEQLCDPDFRLPKTSRELALATGLEDVGLTGNPWWSYTANFRKASSVAASTL
ncbi:class I SAM-dependent methyltransferase [Ktedonospora formicarum]|uniref:Fibrillarin-like rRNA methylase n=1 Tax=Ktedonospora formicarum TaxID=2778364 RepID=A0A8J3MWD6_9CHLR|nr:methyltransferase domain-containing protein [Ktedonospora formicarum]GHO50245.1 fibrillarin-like rRNA methylase [Ktedonospora formicarum]